MRDIGRRINRYRLSRYAPPVDRVRHSLRWGWWLGAAWLVWISLLSNHSLLRIWRLSESLHQSKHQLAQSTAELASISATLRDPGFEIERSARVDFGMARRNEIVYRISSERPASPAP